MGYTLFPINFVGYCMADYALILVSTILVNNIVL